MTEAINPQNIDITALTPALQDGAVEVRNVDPMQVEQVTANLQDQMGRVGYGEYTAQPGQLGKNLLPFRTNEPKEPAGFVVTEGTGAVEVVTGRKDASRSQVKPGSVVLLAGDPDARKAPWLRAAEDNTEELKVTYLTSQDTQAFLHDEANNMISMGARGRERVRDELSRISAKKAKVLGKLATR